MSTAVVYARYSSHSQRDASIDQQLATCRAFAQRGGIDIVDVYTDRALTGTNDNRPGFKKMIADAAKGRWNYVLVYALDRFARDRYDSATNKHKLKECGVKVISATEPITDDPAGVLLESMLEGYAEYYSRELSRKIQRGQLDNAQKCVANGIMPMGYRRGQDGRYEVVPEEAAIVREVFRRIAGGDRMSEISADFNARGIRTKTGRPWDKSSYNRMLSNERYTGVYIYKDVRVDGGIPAIVTPEEFAAVQKILGTKRNPRRIKSPGVPMSRRRESGIYLLTGKLFCGCCGSPLVGVSGTARNRQLHAYYACRGRLTKSAECSLPNIRRDDAEQDIAQAIKKEILTPETIEAIAQASYEYQQKTCAAPDLALLERQLADTERALKNIMAAIEQGIFTTSTRDRLQELEREKSGISARLALARENSKNLPTKAEISATLTYFSTGDLTDKLYQEALIDTFLVRAYIYPDRYELYFSPDAKTMVSAPINFRNATDNCREACNGSYNGRTAPPNRYWTNTYFFSDGFAVKCSL